MISLSAVELFAAGDAVDGGSELIFAAEGHAVAAGGVVVGVVIIVEVGRRQQRRKKRPRLPPRRRSWTRP